MKKSSSVRIIFLKVIIVLICSCVIYRLVTLQVVQRSYYVALAEGQHSLYEHLFPKRGEIFVRDKASQELYPLAINLGLHFVYAVPKDVSDQNEAVEKLAPLLFEYKEEIADSSKQIAEEREFRVWVIKDKEWRSDDGEVLKRKTKDEDIKNGNTYGGLELSKEEELLEKIEESYKEFKKTLLNKLSNKKDPYVVLKRKLSGDITEKIALFNLPGIHLEQEPWRYYPEGDLAAQILGYYGYDDKSLKGQYGIEGYFDKELTGKSGFLEAEKDTKGIWIPIGKKKLETAQDGDSVVLTIDRTIQHKTDEEIKKAVEKYQAEKGSIIVMDPFTGEILALSSYPTFDPNKYNEVENIEVFKNPVISDQYEPGSSFKPIVMAAALDTDTVKPETTYFCRGSIKIDRYTIHTATGEAFGKETMTQILEHSDNIGMAWVSGELGIDKLVDYVRKFGFGELTGVRLDQEANPQIKSKSKWNKVDLATAGFGQGAITITPLQLITALSAVANGGKLIQPYIVSEIIQPDGSIENFRPNVIRQVISPQTSVTLSAMLVSVVEKGYGEPAEVSGYHIAGKTGTAQIARPGGGYWGSKKITSFIGYGPVEDPRFIMLVKLDNPKRGQWGATTAAPVFKEVASYLFKYFQIPPVGE